MQADKITMNDCFLRILSNYLIDFDLVLVPESGSEPLTYRSIYKGGVVVRKGRTAKSKERKIKNNIYPGFHLKNSRHVQLSC